MPSEWRNTTLGALLSFANGKTSPERDEHGKYEVFGSNGAIGRANTTNAPGNTIIVGRVGSYCGSLHYSPGACWVTDNAIRATAIDGNDPRFLLYLLQTLNLNNWRSGSGQPLLNQSILSSIPTAVPGVLEQREIAAALGVLDEKITLLRETNTTLEAIAQALFKSWFVDFDPVRAKAEGLDPIGMPPEVADLFPSEFEDSELGEIPKRWQIRSLDSFATYLNGLALQKYPPESDEEFLPVIKIAQLRVGNTQGSDRASALLKPDYIVRDGDVLFSWSGSLEVEIWCGGEGALNQHLFKVTSNEVPKWFYYLATRHFLPSFRETAAHKATTMGHIQRKHLTESRLALPPAEVLATLSEYVVPIIEKRITNALQARELGTLRDTLLPRLMSGKLRIPEAPCPTA
jgi:type I restriction enzyme S subunit